MGGPLATYADLHRFQRVRASRREPDKAEAKRIAKLEAEQAKLQEDRLEQHASNVADAPAAVGMREVREVREAWAEQLPEDSEAMFAELLAMPQSELLSLLAVCVGLSITAITSHEGDAVATLMSTLGTRYTRALL